jgi:hypothetical protein
MEKIVNKDSWEEQMLQTMSMGIYGRPLQNRCSVLGKFQRQQLQEAVREMATSNIPVADECNEKSQN